MLLFKRVFPIALVFILSSHSSFAYQQIEFIREIGQTGKKARDRQFHEPHAVALTAGRIYVADTDEHRILALNLDGKVLHAWGAKGDKVGEFRSPAGITVDEKGRIYVADTGNHRIQVMDEEGKSLRAFGLKGSSHREFSSPSGIFALRGLLYIADTGNSRVQVVTYDGVFVTEMTVKTKKDEMKSPVAVAADVQQRIYVLDSDNNNVWIFNHNGGLLDQFGTKGKGADGFRSPQGLAVDSQGSIFVSDTGNYKLKKFDPKGKLIASLGSEGDGPGQFQEPAGLAVDQDDRVYMLDSGKHTLQVFSSELGEGQPLAPISPPVTVEIARDYPALAGEVNALVLSRDLVAVMNDSVQPVSAPAGSVPAWGSRGSDPGQLKDPQAAALDAVGNYWVADTGNDRLQKFSPQGKLLQVIGNYGSGEGQFRSPSGIAISAKGNIYVADTGNRRIQVFSAKGMFLGAFGKPGSLAGQFEEPVDLTVNGSELVYVVDRGNDRIAKFDGNGTLLWQIGKTGGLDGEFKSPSNIRISPDGEVYVLDAGNARVQVFDVNGKFIRKFGSEGREPGQFKTPQGLALEGSTRLYVGDRGNRRIEAFVVHQTPVVPREVTAQARPNEVQLSWKSNTESYLEQYRVYRSEVSCGPFRMVGSTKESFFLDKSLPSNRVFFYRISSKAVEGNESSPAEVVSAATPKLVPATPRKVRIEPAERQMTLSWLPNPEPFVSFYRIYRSKQPSTGFELVDKSDKTVFVDGPLEYETIYYYEIAAVGKEGDESPPSEMVFVSTPKAPATVPPVEISRIEMGEIFAAAYKYYESHPLGKVVITNNTDLAYSKVKLSFRIKEYMDYATEMEIEEMAPNQSVELPLKPVFSNKILEVTENTPLQSEIVLTYFINGEPKTVSRSFPVMLYQRNAIRWDQKAKVGSFITYKDAVVSDFTRLAIQPYVDVYPTLPQPLVYARAVYDALGVLGVSYILDPTPFQEFSENNTIVDYTSYPREVLMRKSGDCDGLSMLFVSALENVGIEGALVDVPGHVFALFNTGVDEKEKATLGFDSDLLAVHDGMVWIPVEMTIVGNSFTRAWQKGAEEYRDWSAKGKLEIIDVHKAWETFKPVTLPPADFKAPKVSRDEIEAKYKNELESLSRQRLAVLSAGYLEDLKANKKDVDALTQLGILYGENGFYPEALEQFQKILGIQANDATALNNIGNIYLVQERLDDARIAYEAAYKNAPEDTGVMTNLARVLYRLGKNDEAKKLFQAAASIDPRVIRRHGELAARLGVLK
jgi:sugar lactone lactonase YvrE